MSATLFVNGGALTLVADGSTSGLGTITGEESVKDAGLFFMPMPASDSNAAFLLDIMGTTRTITVNGIYVGATTNDVANFVSTVDGIVNGNQTPSVWVSSVSGSYTVMLSSFRWKSEIGAPLKSEYSITFQECGV